MVSEWESQHCLSSEQGQFASDQARGSGAHVNDCLDLVLLPLSVLHLQLTLHLF